MASQKTLTICDKGHRYSKSSDCPTCPVCEQERKPDAGFLSRLSNPARRALEHHGIATVQELSAYTQREILQFHGIGPSSMPVLRQALESQGLAFKAEAKPEPKKAGPKAESKRENEPG